MERNRIDLSKLERDNLMDLLNTAKNEWVKYIKCRGEVEWCEKCIEKEKETVNGGKGGCFTWLSIWCVFTALVLGFIYYYKGMDGNYMIFMLFSAPFSAIVFFLIGRWVKSSAKTAQRKLAEYEPQLLELQQKEMVAIYKFDKVHAIPDEYCYEYAFTKMMQYMDNGRAHNWKEVTALYEQHLYEETMKENTRITAEEAKKQTDIARETRNAARAAAAGAWVSAIRR